MSTHKIDMFRRAEWISIEHLFKCADDSAADGAPYLLCAGEVRKVCGEFGRLGHFVFSSEPTSCMHQVAMKLTESGDAFFAAGSTQSHYMFSALRPILMSFQMDDMFYIGCNPFNLSETDRFWKEVASSPVLSQCFLESF